MTKVALLCDSHAGIRNDNPAFHTYQKKCFDWFFDTIDSKSIKNVIHLGDIYDRRRYVSILTANRLRVDFLDRLEERGIQTHILQGNHDQYYKEDHGVNALDELVNGRYTNIKTYNVPTLIDIDGIPIQLLPWITRTNELESIQAIENPKAKYMMGHLQIHGAKMHKHMIADHGLDNVHFKNYDKVFSGHFHHRSVIGNVHYLGAFGEYTWNDYNDPRGFGIFDPATGQVEYMDNPHKMFRAIVYDDIKVPNIIEEIQKKDFGDYKDCYVKLVITNKSNPWAFDLLFDSLFKAEPLDIEILEDSSLLQDTTDLEMDTVESTPEILQKYVNGLTLPVDNDKMSSFMLDIYHEALTVEN